MGWTAPRTYTAGEIITASILNSAVRDNLSYLKGIGQVPTIQSGLTIDNSLGSERLLLPLLSTAECSTVLNAAGEVAFDETTHQMKAYDGTAVRAMISEADVDDTPVNGVTTFPVSSNWAYDHANIITTAGDIRYCTSAGVDTRLGIGTIGHILSVDAGGTAPEWRAETARTNKLNNETRDMTAASGDVAYTGYGFQPTSLIIFAGREATYGASWGIGDVNLGEYCLAQVQGGVVYLTATIITLWETYNSTGQTAVLKTLDADGFTLTWTKLATPGANTAGFAVLALR